VILPWKEAALLLAGVVALLLILKADAAPLNTITLTNTPSYGGAAVFTVHLGKHYTDPKAALFCYQGGTSWVYGRERIFVSKYGKTFDGSVTFAPLPDAFSPAWDSTQPANCAVVLFNEPSSATRPEVAISEWAEFVVSVVD